MAIDRSIKVGIGTSIAATVVFIYFLDPILTFFGRHVVQLLGRVCSGYIDGLYEKAALCSTFDAAFALLCVVMSLFCGGSLGFCSGMIAAALHRKKGVAPLSTLIQTRLSFGKIITLAVILTILIHVSTIFTLWGGWFQAKTTSSFCQHMKAVAPYLTEQEEKLVWSQWTQMQSRQDYDRIYSQLRQVAEKNGIRLP